MIPSLINVILCALVIGFAIVDKALTGATFISIIGVVLLFNFISFLMALHRKKLAKEQMRILKELLSSYEVKANCSNLNEYLKLITEEVLRSHQRTNVAHNKSSLMKEQVNHCIGILRNINRTLNYLTNNNYQEIKELIKNYNRTNIENLAEQAKISFHYETHYDEPPVGNFDGYTVAVLLNDALEDFIVCAWLRQQGFKTQSFNNAQDFSNFDLVVADDMYDISDGFVLYFSNHQSKAGCLKRPFDRLSFLKSIVNLLNNQEKTNRIISVKNKPANDTLIFMPNAILNSQMLHEVNKHAGANKAVSSLSEFKRELNNEYKIIMLSAECVLFDYEDIKALLNEAKLRSHELFIMVFYDQKLRESFDFADWLIKDATQAQIIEVIKKHL